LQQKNAIWSALAELFPTPLSPIPSPLPSARLHWRSPKAAARPTLPGLIEVGDDAALFGEGETSMIQDF